jgi:lipopolysaccharide transport system permease protein
VIYGVNPGFAVLLSPLWTLMVILLASGIGMVTAALTVRYRDVNYFVPFVLQFLLYASPIAYSIDNVPAKYRIIYEMNPLTWLLQEFQWSFVRQPFPHLWEIVASIIVPIIVFVGGAVIFEQMERGFADVI